MFYEQFVSISDQGNLKYAIFQWSLVAERVQSTKRSYPTNSCVLVRTSCFGVHARCTSWEALLRLAVLLHRRRHHRRNGNQVVFRTGPSGPAAPVHRGARRPWRPLHLRRPVCRGTAQTRNRDFLSCSGLGGCRRPLLDHTSRKHVWGFRAMFGTLSCPLWGKSCHQRLAVPYRNSWWLASRWGLAAFRQTV